MPFALSLAANNDSALPIRALWDRFAPFEHAPSQRALGYHPHVTLAIYEGEAVSEPEALAALRRATAGEAVIPLVFDQILNFEGDPLVFWAAPRPNEALQRLHRAVHAAIDSARCHVHYRPEYWTPHCTLASDIRSDHASEARALAASFKATIAVDFDIVDCVSFQPVRIVRTCRLAPQ